MSDFSEDRIDYSAKGRWQSGSQGQVPELIIFVGVSGSGKSVLARQWVNEGHGDVVRLNRDNLRTMLYQDVSWLEHEDDLIRPVEREMARVALKKGKSVIVDDTNCVRRTRTSWQELARELHVILRVITMTTPLKICIERDAARPGKECVGKEVILLQFGDLNRMVVDPNLVTRPMRDKEQLLNKCWDVRLPGAKWVLVDMDGTLANCFDVRNAYDERVLLDKPYPVVVEWVRVLYQEHNVLILSGRKERSGDDTCTWLEREGVPFDHMLMRATPDNRPDRIVKKELLDMFLQIFKKEEIAFVLDDRPVVVRTWKENGLTVYPVRGTTDHSQSCPKDGNPKLTCLHCGALGDF